MRRVFGFLAFVCLIICSSAAFGGSDEAVERMEAGKRLLEQGKVDAAIEEFSQAAALDPTSGAPHLNLGQAYERANRNDSAIAAYRKAAELKPNNFFAHNNLGVLLDQKGAYTQAIASFEHALRSEPGNVMAQKNLETAKKNNEVLKEREAAIARVEKDARSKPDDEQLAYQAARVYAFYGKKEAALQWLNKAMKLGFKDLNYIKSDPAFVGMRAERDFELLLLKK